MTWEPSRVHIGEAFAQAAKKKTTPATAVKPRKVGNITQNYNAFSECVDGSYADITGPKSPATKPMGVDPRFTSYLATSGLLVEGGDMLSSAGPKQYAGNDFGNWWKLVFPAGSNDCELQAAINNVQDKVDQFKPILAMGIKQFVQSPEAGMKGGGCAGCQGDAYAYIEASNRALNTILSQYKDKYAKGKGCPDAQSQTCCGATMNNDMPLSGSGTKTCKSTTTTGTTTTTTPTNVNGKSNAIYWVVGGVCALALGIGVVVYLRRKSA